MANFNFVVGVLAIFVAGICNGNPLPEKIEGMADLWNLGVRFEFGNGDSSHNYKFLETILKNHFTSKDANTRPDRPGDAVEYHACDRISSVPRHLTFITRYNFYQKYTHAYGIPVIGSNRPSDEALKRACYVLRFLLGDRRILRHYLYKYYGRIGIMATTEVTRSIPEHRFLPAWWDTRARGLGGTIAVPMSSGAEENLLCLPSDRYHAEDIFLHEFSHGIQEISVRGGGIPGFWERLQRQYAYAKSVGLWRNTYAMSTPQEYFAEAVQSFFNVNDYANPPNGIHGPINTRPKLKNYDPAIYRMILEVFPCQNYILDRCKRGAPIPPFKMNCDGDGPRTQHPPTEPPQPPTDPPTTTQGTTTLPPPTTEPKDMNCDDTNEHCRPWADRGYCEKYSGYTQYMMRHCSESCRCCKNDYDYCDAWKKKGFCAAGHKYQPWMEKNCRKSCKVCQRIMMAAKYDEAVHVPPPML